MEAPYFSIMETRARQDSSKGTPGKKLLISEIKDRKIPFLGSGVSFHRLNTERLVNMAVDDDEANYWSSGSSPRGDPSYNLL